MGILKYINGNPLFSTAKEALDYAEDIGFNTDEVHVHKYTTGINLFRTGYMPGATHEDLMVYILHGGPTSPNDPRDPKDPEENGDDVIVYDDGRGEPRSNGTEDVYNELR